MKSRQELGCSLSSALGKQEDRWVTAFLEAAHGTRSTTINYCTVGYQTNYLSGCSAALVLWRKAMMY